MISNSGHDERGKYSGGAAGDQTGGEWARIAWYSRPWTVVLRHPVPAVRGLIAQLAGEAADNDKVGYDQGQRRTFYEKLKAAGWFPSKISADCEADCSAGVAAIVIASGNILGEEQLRVVSSDMYTGNERQVLKAAGFTALTESKYLTSDRYLLPGDILLYDGHHTAINLDYGSKTERGEMTPNDIISATAAFYKIQRAGGYTYGDSHSLPPCADHVTSCERGAVARPLWDLGFHDQPAGGITVLNMEQYLTKWGFKKITDQNALKAGDIVLMKQNGTTAPTAEWHTFLVTAVTKSGSVMTVNKYDFGSQERLRAAQPFVGVPVNQWPGVKSFYCAFRWGGGDSEIDTTVDYTFDADYYRAAYKDVTSSGFGSSAEGLKRHYDSFGRKEGRAANCLLTPSYYKAKYTDLKKAFGSDWTKYIDHWTTYGVKEGRRGSVVFDWSYYRKTYADLKKAFGNDKWKYCRHFVQYGMKEGRRGSAEFDPRAYRKRYKDLDKAFGDNWKLYYIHYLIYGQKEKRKAT